MNQTSASYASICFRHLMHVQKCNTSLTTHDDVPGRTRYTEPVSEPWIYIAMACLLSTTTAISLLTNGTVIYVLFVKKRCFLTRINSYIATVCILAIVTSLFGCPMVISSSFVGHWLFSDVGCTYYGFLMTFCGLASMYMLTIIAVDRYLMVVRGVFDATGGNIFSHLATSGALVLSFTFSVPPLVGWNRYTYEGFATSCSPDISDDSTKARVYLMFLLVVVFAIPISVMTFCYWRIFYKILEIRKVISNTNTETPYTLKQKRFTAVEIRIAMTMVSIVGAFLLCWTPYAAILIWSVVKSAHIPVLTSAIPTMLTKTGSCLTPLVYLWRNRKMQKVVMEIYPCLKSYRRKRPLLTRGRPRKNIPIRTQQQQRKQTCSHSKL